MPHPIRRRLNFISRAFCGPCIPCSPSLSLGSEASDGKNKPGKRLGSRSLRLWSLPFTAQPQDQGRREASCSVTQPFGGQGPYSRADRKWSMCSVSLPKGRPDMHMYAGRFGMICLKASNASRFNKIHK